MADDTTKESQDAPKPRMKTDAKAVEQAQPAQTKPSVAVTAPAPVPADDDDGAPDIPVADLIARAYDFLNCPTYVAAGALSEYDPADELSIGQAQEIVAEWLDQPVDTDSQED